MKNMYFGDIGDFEKYGLLTALTKSKIKLGVNWYLTEDELNSNDGKFTEYLTLNNFNKELFRNCDCELFDYLLGCVKNNERHVYKIEEIERFQDIKFYCELLKIDHIKALNPRGRNERLKIREQWFNNSINVLKDCSVVFLDPDNGIETQSLSKTSRDSVKYVYYDEIRKIYNLGKNVIVYNHRDRSKEEDYLNRFRKISQVIFEDNTIFSLRFNRYSVRDYVFILHDKDKMGIFEIIEEFLSSQWGQLFHL